MKLIFAILAALIVVLGYIPYLRDIFARKTKPHIYTWFIWIITQGIALAGLLYGGGSWASLGFIAGLALIFVVFLLSFIYGTKNITMGDTVMLVLAFLSIFVWIFLKNPLASVLMVTFIDAVGYVPTFRKTYEEPYSETPIFWFMMVLSAVFGILALSEFNLLTLTYISMTAVVNTALALMILWRRKNKLAA